MARVLLFGAGATGARIARQLRSSGAVDTLEIRDPSLERRDRLVDDLGDGAVAGRGRRISDDPAAGIIATPPGTQLDVARRAIREGIAVVTTSNQTSEVRRLLELEDEARSRRIPVVVCA